MRAAQYAEIGGPIGIVEVAEPQCPVDGAIVAVRATGVCRSDWHAWRGHDPVALPHIPGHEFAGEVIAVGSQVHRWRPGGRVTAPFVNGCGRCEWCVAGEVQVCPNQRQPGFTDPGSFAEQVVVHAADLNLVGLPDGLSYTTAAALGCRFATAFRAVTAHGRVRPGQRVAVFGCGGVGLSAVMIATALGAEVVAVDISAAARERAIELGAVAAVEATGDTVTAVIAATGGGAHLTLDCLGRSGSAVDAMRSLRRRGRHVQVGLLLGDEATPPLPMDRVIAWELELYGSHGMAPGAYPAMLDLVARGELRPDRLVGRVIDLNGAGAALAAMDGPAAGVGLTVIEL